MSNRCQKERVNGPRFFPPLESHPVHSCVTRSKRSSSVTARQTQSPRSPVSPQSLHHGYHLPLENYPVKPSRRRSPSPSVLSPDADNTKVSPVPGPAPTSSSESANAKNNTHTHTHTNNFNTHNIPVHAEPQSRAIQVNTHEVQKDSFGNLLYRPLFKTHGQPHTGSSPERDLAQMDSSRTMRWEGAEEPNRNPHPSNDPDEGAEEPFDFKHTPGAHSRGAFSQIFGFLRKRQFWVLFEFAVRISLIGILLPCLVLHYLLPNRSFLMLNSVLSGVLISTSMTVGQVNFFILQYVRATCFWLPCALFCVSVHLDRYVVPWFAVYVTLIFLMAFFTDKTTRRIALMMLTIAMVDILSGDESWYFAFKILTSWSIGVGLSWLLVLFPYPLQAHRNSEALLRRLLQDTATCFAGMLSCFWAASNTERHMGMARIRYLLRSIEYGLEDFAVEHENAFYEVPLLLSAACYDVQAQKSKLLLELKMNLRILQRAVNELQERPQLLTDCTHAAAFQGYLSQPIQDLSRAVGEVLRALQSAPDPVALQRLHERFDATAAAAQHTQTAFDAAQREVLYANADLVLGAGTRMEEFFPVFALLLFAVENFCNVLGSFHARVCVPARRRGWGARVRELGRMVVRPSAESLGRAWELVRGARPETVRVFIEAAKVSLAMFISVVFFYNVDNQNLLLSGPTVIAFVSGMNPVETVHASGIRLTGTLMGSVIGFFATTLSSNEITRAVWICAIVFVMSFARFNQEFGPICSSCTYVAMTLLSSKTQGATYTISRIQQNAFAIFIYCFVSITIFPLSPGEVLHEKRLDILRDVFQCFRRINRLLYETVQQYRAIVQDDCSPYNNNNDASPASGSELTTTQARWRELPSPGSFYLSRDGALTTAGASRVPDPAMQIIPVEYDADELCPGHQNARHSLAQLYSTILPHTFYKDTKDVKITLLLDEIFRVFNLVVESRSIMTFAANEFTLLPTHYPIRATGDVHNALSSLCVLLYAMACSWGQMRAKKYFTFDVARIFHNLWPLVEDLTLCLEQFVQVTYLYVREPSPNLCSELMQGVTHFRRISLELNVRTESDLIFVIRDSILSYLSKHPQLLEEVQKHAEKKTNVDIDNKNQNDNNNNNNTSHRQSLQPSRKARPRTQDRTSSPSPPSSERVDNVTGVFAPSDNNGTKRSSKNSEIVGKSFAQRACLSTVASPVPSDVSRDDEEDKMIQLGQSFEMPTKASDLEGMHTFTTTLVMFGRELRKILFGLEEMLQAS